MRVLSNNIENFGVKRIFRLDSRVNFINGGFLAIRYFFYCAVLLVFFVLFSFKTKANVIDTIRTTDKYYRAFIALKDNPVVLKYFTLSQLMSLVESKDEQINIISEYFTNSFSLKPVDGLTLRAVETSFDIFKYEHLRKEREVVEIRVPEGYYLTLFPETELKFVIPDEIKELSKKLYGSKK